ncbi:uncharacterized protein LOC125273390 isoform X6 [Megalobrama amblycephala]|uniref:uncharacterized protein LOC125273390 isoform X6 n=1 Tax=Megalobrama amblycephala TaxID=75352 RepID=UPI002014485B|nr:uncharacterized protein LOC125273390 isoform X6 [Megalobrama amblycephala]
MEGESITDTESETESEWDPESSTEYDSLSENDREKKGKRGGKRKRKYSSQNLRQTIENQLELPVKCGAKDGVLYVEKYNDMQACIFSEGQWFKPIDFERFGGKARSKKWRNSIVYNDIPLQELIRDGLLLPFKKYGVQNKQNDSPESSPVTDRLRKRKYVAQIGSPESSSVTVRLRKRKCRRQPFHSEPKESINGSEDGDGDSDNNDVNEVLDLDDDDDDDVIDLSMFEGPTLPVTCGSESGILHKYRFAKGHRGRCIRTENFWLTPENFIKLNKPEGTWRKDIVTNEIPLGKLIMKRVLEPHMINCYCEICEEQDQYQQNDDVCFVCNSEGDLVCCDECPRAFHSHCHLPAADGDSLGSQWSCTFCVMKNMKDSSQKTQQEVLSSPVSQYTLHCQYLLLHLLHESMTEPCTNVSGYSKNICSPMMLGRVKLNLENNDYQTVQEFVSDIEQIFNYCCTSNGDNDSSRMTSRLKEAFKKEFETVFKICELMGVSGQLDPDFLTNEQLLLFLRRKKISCIEQPHAFLTQLRDHDLMPEKLFEAGTRPLYIHPCISFIVIRVIARTSKTLQYHRFMNMIIFDHVWQMHAFWTWHNNSTVSGHSAIIPCFKGMYYGSTVLVVVLQ